MATPLSRADYKARYNHASTGLYKANTTQDIGSDDHRDMIDNSDSFLNIVDDLLDEDAMTSNSATKVASQQSIKAYVDAQVAGSTSIPYGATTGTNTYSATMSPVVSAYADGDMYHIRVGISSTGAITLDLGPGAKEVWTTAGTQALAGHLLAGVDYLFTYNSALDSAAGAFVVVGELNHGLMNLRGSFTSSGGGLWPSSGGSGPSGAIRHGDTFVMSDADTLGAKVVNAGDFITTAVDAPGQTDSSWYVIPGPASLALKATLASPALTGTPTVNGESVAPGLEVIAATGTAIAFAVPQFYGSPGTPETGNVTLVTTGLVPGMVQTLYHDNGTEPTWPAEFVRLSGNYSITVLNIIDMRAISATRIEYIISQEQ